jgi:hypothetical protein
MSKCVDRGVQKIVEDNLKNKSEGVKNGKNNF